MATDCPRFHHSDRAAERRFSFEVPIGYCCIPARPCRRSERTGTNSSDRTRTSSANMRSATRHIAAALLAVLGAASVALAQDGGAPTEATSSPGERANGPGLCLSFAAFADGASTMHTESAGYSCDSSKCKLPDCLVRRRFGAPFSRTSRPRTDLHSASLPQCASTSPPGGLSPQDVPQFITFTADDAIQIPTIEVMNHYLANRSVRRFPLG